MTRHGYALDGWGDGELWLAKGTVVMHEIHWTPLRRQTAAGTVPTSSRGTVPGGGRSFADGAPALARDLIERVRAQLAGRPMRFDDVPLDLEWCTPFQASLAATLKAVPWAEVVSYGELAALAGRPGAARAAGSFCAHNRFALFLPCHRVVSAGGIGGYGRAGVELKRRLLELEGVKL